MSDSELVHQTLRGEAEAFAELVRRWATRILALCHARVGKHDVAEDLSQETFLRGFRSLATLSDPERFGAWLAGIARRVCIDWLKSPKRKTVNLSSLPTPWSEPSQCDQEEASAGKAEELERLLREIEQLPESFRDVLLLYYYEDVTYGDLAELLGVSVATINARLTKARAMLRDKMTAFAEQDS